MIPMKMSQISRLIARSFIPCAIAAACHTTALAQFEFHDWTSAFLGNGYSWTNTSSAGTVVGSDFFPPVPGFAGTTGTYGVPTAITAQNIFTHEFQIQGINGLGSSVNFVFSNGYGWGTGGELLIGNIHNYYEYTVSAWDFNNVPIDVNTWATLAEYDSTAPGSSGYFSTSTTSRSASGLSTNFFVFDNTADANSGQGGVVLVGGLVDVGRIELTFTASNLAPNLQFNDFILFNVGTPVPEPSTFACLLGGLGLLGLRRRRALAQPLT